MLSLSWKLWLQTVAGTKFPILWLLLRPFFGILPLIVVINGFVEEGFGLLLLFATCVSNSVNLLIRSFHRVEKQVNQILSIDTSKIKWNHEFSFILRVIMQTFLPFCVLSLILLFPEYFPILFLWAVCAILSIFILFLFIRLFRNSVWKLYIHFPDSYQASRYYAPFGFVLTFVAVTIPISNDLIMGLVLGLSPVGIMTALPLWHYASISGQSLLVCIFVFFISHLILSIVLNRITSKYVTNQESTLGDLDEM